MASTNKLSPIPHPPKKPVVGNMLSLDPNAPVQHLVRLTKELGPIFWLDMMGAPLVIVSGHDLVDELSDEKRFDKAVRGPLRRVRTVAGDGLFTADTNEPNWSKAHNILMQPFGNRAMQSYHPSMVDIAEQLVKKWERLNADDEIDVVHDMTALTLDTIGLCGFDYRFNSFYRRDYHPFVESLVRSLETIMMIRGLPLENLWMQKRRRDLATDVAFMNEMVDEIVAERRRPLDRRTARRRQHPLPDQHIPDRRTRDDQRPVVLHDLRALEAPGGAAEGLRGSRPGARSRYRRQADLPAGHPAQLHHANPQGGAAAVAAGAGLWHRAAPGRDHRRKVQAQEEH